MFKNLRKIAEMKYQELEYEPITYSICGAITDATKEEKELFYKAEEKLKIRGYKVFNPLRFSDENPGHDWNFYMEECIRQLVKNRHILVLPTIWNGSKGASLELRIAADMDYVMEMYDAF